MEPRKLAEKDVEIWKGYKEFANSKEGLYTCSDESRVRLETCPVLTTINSSKMETPNVLEALAEMPCFWIWGDGWVGVVSETGMNGWRKFPNLKVATDFAASMERVRTVADDSDWDDIVSYLFE